LADQVNGAAFEWKANARVTFAVSSVNARTAPVVVVSRLIVFLQKNCQVYTGRSNRG